MNNYIVIENISSGEFGKVVKVKNKFTEKILAVKIEKINIGTLQYEAKIYNILSGLTNIPVIRSFKNDSINNYLFMDLMDYNLKYVKKKKFSYDIKYISLCKTIIVNLIKALKKIHEKKVLHRDIKPENICFSNGIIKIIDFGLSKVIDYSQNKLSGIVGTPNFISLNVLNLNSSKIEDDLESLAYIFIYIISDDKIFQKYCDESNIDKKNIDVIKKYIQSEYLNDILEKHITICRDVNNNTNNNAYIYNNLIELYN